jgi:hypothetical protein
MQTTAAAQAASPASTQCSSDSKRLHNEERTFICADDDASKANAKALSSSTARHTSDVFRLPVVAKATSLTRASEKAIARIREFVADFQFAGDWLEPLVDETGSESALRALETPPARAL